MQRDIGFNELALVGIMRTDQTTETSRACIKHACYTFLMTSPFGIKIVDWNCFQQRGSVMKCGHNMFLMLL